MENPTRKIQEKHYRELFQKHRGTTMAVSSESPAHKELRFEHIAEIFENDDEFSVHDIGMGISDFYSFLEKKFSNKKINYSGSDILKEFVDESVSRYPNLDFYHRDISVEKVSDKYDYVIMSGLFHQRRESSIREWEKFACNIIRNAFEMSQKGIAFNFISPFVDFYQTEVYYSNLVKIINFINDDLSRFFEIKHHYALFEYTVFVFTKDYIKSQHPQKEFQKYF